ncbi:MAG: hypothetical protein R2706_01230 [Acidimicrobiales bacterium]
MALRAARAELSPELINKIRPVTLAQERVLPVPEALLPLFPWGGLPRGSTVGVQGSGSWSLAMALMAESLGSQGWLAVVGAPSFGLAAASGFGIRLDRVLVVEEPGRSRWGAVVSALLESVDMVAIDPDAAVGARDARRLAARAREQESILFHLDGGKSWPTGLDTSLSVDIEGWVGIGQGHGHLQARQANVRAVGRRSGAPNRSVSVWLPGPDGRLVAAPANVSEFRPRLVG